MIQVLSATNSPSVQLTNTKIHDAIGKFGLWNSFMLLFIFTVTGLLFINNFSMNFLVPSIDHWCKMPESFHNMSHEDWLDFAVPKLGGDKHSHCRRYKLIRAGDKLLPDYNTTVPCKEWEYDPSAPSTATLVTEWDLVCSRAWMTFLPELFLILGLLLGSFVGGQSADVYGRRPVIVAGILLSAVSGAFSCMAVNIVTCLAGQLILSAGVVMAIISARVLFVETVYKKCRCFYVIFHGLAGRVGLIILTSVSAIRTMESWRVVYGIQFVTMLLLLTLCKLYYESPRWCLVTKEYGKAGKAVRKIAVFNRVPSTTTALRFQELLRQYSAGEDGSFITTVRPMFFALFRHKSAPRIALSVATLHCFTNGFLYFTEDPTYKYDTARSLIDLNVVLSVEIIVILTATLLTRFIWRRFTMAALFLLITSMLMIQTIFSYNERFLFYTIVQTLLKSSVQMSVLIYWVYSCELFPTPLRGSGAGWCAMAVFVGLLLQYTLSLGKPASTIVCIGLSCVSFLACFFLPETLHVDLEDLPERTSPVERGIVSVSSLVL